jgi:hypothetical protein
MQKSKCDKKQQSETEEIIMTGWCEYSIKIDRMGWCTNHTYDTNLDVNFLLKLTGCIPLSHIWLMITAELVNFNRKLTP